MEPESTPPPSSPPELFTPIRSRRPRPPASEAPAETALVAPTPSRRLRKGAMALSEQELTRVKRRKYSNRNERPEVSVFRLAKSMARKAAAVDTTGCTLEEAKAIAGTIVKLYGEVAISTLREAQAAKVRLADAAGLALSPEELVLLERVARVRAADLKHFVACVGIASDKLLLLSGQPTQRIEVQGSEGPGVSELAAKLAKLLADRKTG